MVPEDYGRKKGMRIILSKHFNSSSKMKSMLDVMHVWIITGSSKDFVLCQSKNCTRQS